MTKTAGAGGEGAEKADTTSNIEPACGGLKFEFEARGEQGQGRDFLEGDFKIIFRLQ